jgi:hypothetical protein
MLFGQAERGAAIPGRCRWVSAFTEQELDRLPVAVLCGPVQWCEAFRTRDVDIGTGACEFLNEFLVAKDDGAEKGPILSKKPALVFHDVATRSQIRLCVRLGHRF